MHILAGMKLNFTKQEFEKMLEWLILYLNYCNI